MAKTSAFLASTHHVVGMERSANRGASSNKACCSSGHQNPPEPPWQCAPLPFMLPLLLQWLCWLLRFRWDYACNLTIVITAAAIRPPLLLQERCNHTGRHRWPMSAATRGFMKRHDQAAVKSGAAASAVERSCACRRTE